MQAVEAVAAKTDLATADPAVVEQAIAKALPVRTWPLFF